MNPLLLTGLLQCFNQNLSIHIKVEEEPDYQVLSLRQKTGLQKKRDKKLQNFTQVQIFL